MNVIETIYDYSCDVLELAAIFRGIGCDDCSCCFGN